MIKYLRHLYVTAFAFLAIAAPATLMAEAIDPLQAFDPTAHGLDQAAIVAFLGVIFGLILVFFGFRLARRALRWLTSG